ncbi:MAG: lytic transglycosylase domain-containing protein [Succinivibrio sp.]
MWKTVNLLLAASAATGCFAAVNTGVMTLEVEQSEVLVTNQIPTENRIDSIDVYKLAPSSYLLYKGQMMSQFLYLKYSDNKGLRLLLPFISKAASKNGVEAELIAAVITVESSCIHNAVSKSGAKGLMQLMPDTAKELEVKDPFDPEQNILAGSKYLGRLLREFDTLQLALAAYNAGPAVVKRYQGIPPYTETKNFVKRVMDRYLTFREQGIAKVTQ